MHELAPATKEDDMTDQHIDAAKLLEMAEYAVDLEQRIGLAALDAPSQSRDQRINDLSKNLRHAYADLSRAPRAIAALCRRVIELEKAARTMALAVRGLMHEGVRTEYIYDALDVFPENPPDTRKVAKALQDLSRGTFKLPLKELEEALAALTGQR